MRPPRFARRIMDKLVVRTRRFTKSLNPYIPEKLGRRRGDAPLIVEENSIKKQGNKFVLVLFAIFLVWAATAPIDEGVVLNGSVVVKDHRKAVQHHQGGVVEKIYVREGDIVKQGDVLVAINPLNVDAELLQTEYAYINASAAYSRLISERTKQNNIKWAPELARFDGSEQLLEAKRLQTEMFKSRRLELETTRQILLEKGMGLAQQLQEKQEVLRLKRSQLAPLAEDAKNLRVLSEKGFVPKLRANDAERSSVDAQAGISQLQSDIANLTTDIAANKLELVKLDSQFAKDVDASITDSQRTKETLWAKVVSLQFDKKHTLIRAPVGGTVVGLKVHTEGGVISTADVLMEIVPLEPTLIAEIAVPPGSIDKIKVDSTVDMRFTAFNKTTTPVVPGIVRLVGADRLPPKPPRFPEEYYLAQVETTPEGIDMLEENQIVTGMPVEVVVKNGERTFLSYIFKPLADRFARSFKE